MSEENVTFAITCTMRARWVPHFLGMLKAMQRMGSVGSSRHVSIMADGDGDFRPKFEWGKELPGESAGFCDTGGNYHFDAG
jgi:hypothetical protein